MYSSKPIIISIGSRFEDVYSDQCAEVIKSQLQQIPAIVASNMDPSVDDLIGLRAALEPRNIHLMNNDICPVGQKEPIRNCPTPALE